MGNDTYVPEEFRCMVMGGSYEPPFVSRIMPKGVSNRSGAAKYGGAVLDCQDWCRNTTGCVHFSIQYPSRTCSLADSRAKLQFPISKTVSGPVSCEGEPRVKPNCTCPDDEDGNASQEDGNVSREPSDSVVNNVELMDFPVLEQFGRWHRERCLQVSTRLVFSLVLMLIEFDRLTHAACRSRATAKVTSIAKATSIMH